MSNNPNEPPTPPTPPTPPATPYINVIGLQTEYEIGESLNISNAKIQYYASQTAETYTEVDLMSTMVSNFSTDSAGTFVMTITYNGTIKNITYIVKLAPTPPVEYPSNPRIIVLNLQTEYIIGDKINLTNAKIHYYPSYFYSESYSEIALKSNMISGFSTNKTGSFVMTITYKNATKNVAYTVKLPIPQTDEKEKQEAASLLTSALKNMETYAEIKSTTNISILGTTTTTITTLNKQYNYVNENSMYWIIKENDLYIQYSICYDSFNEEKKYNKYTVQTNAANLIEYQFSVLNPNITKNKMYFVKTSTTEKNTIITYLISDIEEQYMDLVISNNKLISYTVYYKQNNFNITVSETILSYYTTLTNTIPEIPSQDWKAQGLLIQ